MVSVLEAATSDRTLQSLVDDVRAAGLTLG
jgi:hypothetical protein